MIKCKDFLDVAAFEEISKNAMSTHLSKPEVVEIMRVLATKYADLSNFKQAKHYIGRAEALAGKRLGTREHYRVLDVLICKLEILLKQVRCDAEDEYVEACAGAEEAIDLSVRLYGESSVPCTQAKYLYAMLLSRIKQREGECEELLNKAEAQMEAVCAQVQPAESCNMLFNLLCDYTLNLNNFVPNVTHERRVNLEAKLLKQMTVNTHYQLYKRAFVTFLRMHIEEDPSALLAELAEVLTLLRQPGSALPRPSYVEIMVKFFQANLSHRAGDADSALRIATELLERDIGSYFGHSQSDIAITPRMIIMSDKFDKLSAMQVSDSSPQAEIQAYRKALQETLAYAQETEAAVTAVQGEASDNLIEVHSLFSFIGYQTRNEPLVLASQRKASEICLQNYGEVSQAYLRRLLEQVSMESQCASVKRETVVSGLKRANEIAREVSTSDPAEQAQRHDILKQLYDLQSHAGDLPGALEAVKELV